mmetsp:Transcript_72484/g.151284  ORF Transcript_72484/g.151284 Transcript_72484/m.151284 type:complete len:226 (+) Transcript_72484:1514-2191(+)
MEFVLYSMPRGGPVYRHLREDIGCCFRIVWSIGSRPHCLPLAVWCWPCSFIRARARGEPWHLGVSQAACHDCDDARCFRHWPHHDLRFNDMDHLWCRDQQTKLRSLWRCWNVTDNPDSQTACATVVALLPRMSVKQLCSSRPTLLSSTFLFLKLPQSEINALLGHMRSDSIFRSCSSGGHAVPWLNLVKCGNFFLLLLLFFLFLFLYFAFFVPVATWASSCCFCR